MSKTNNSPVEQELLIRQLSEGNELAYEVLFKEYYVCLVIHANKYVGDMEIAKEIVQDLFVSVYEKRKKLNISTSLKSYLYKAVQNRSINYLNAQKSKMKYTKYMLNHADKLENSVENILDKTELESALYKAISELPEKCRLIFKMNRFEGLSNGEIAERLELSKRTVETQISKALKQLRSKLQPFLEQSIAVVVVGLSMVLI